MNYDLAMMALTGMARAPIAVTTEDGQVVIRATQASFKELARLCLLLGGEGGAESGGFELQPGVHTAAGTLGMRLDVV